MIVKGRSLAPNIDRLILSFVELRWLKVARIIGDVSTALEKEGKSIDWLRVGVRVEALVKAGLLESKGNVKRWRYSEVRRPASPRPKSVSHRQRTGTRVRRSIGRRDSSFGGEY